MADASVSWMTRLIRDLIILTILTAIAGAGVACANLGNLQQIIQPPRFEQAAGQPAEIRLLGPSANTTRRLRSKAITPRPVTFHLGCRSALVSRPSCR
jgi:hypothetical protein